MPNDLPTALRDLLVDFLAPLDEAARSPAALAGWLASLGHTDAVAADPALLRAAQHAQAVLAKLRALDASALDSADGLSSLLATGREVGAVVQEIRAVGADPARSAFAGGLAEEVTAYLLASWLRRRHPTAFRVAALLTLVDARESAAGDPPVVVNGVTVRHARW